MWQVSIATGFHAKLVFLEIRTLVTWLKSTLLPKIECFDTHIYMKHNCLQTKWDAALLIEKIEGREEERVALIKRLI